MVCEGLHHATSGNDDVGGRGRTGSHVTVEHFRAGTCLSIRLGGFFESGKNDVTSIFAGMTQ